MQKIRLTKEIMRVLKPALFLAKGTIKTEILNGVSQLHVASNGKLFIVLRPENQELVVVAVAGSGLYQSRQEIINFALINNFKTIRFHTRKPELLSRALSGLNIQLVNRDKSLFGDEYIYRLGLNYV